MKLFSNTPIRRYTPPTCTLELWDKRSCLSRWRKEASPKELNFVLNFDDPKLLEEQQVTLQGNFPQLEVLCDVVACYAQNFLYQTVNYLTVTNQSSFEDTICSAESSSSTPSIEKIDELNLPPSLRPKGFLSHQLNLGSLETKASHSFVSLTSSQLFDLLNALEDYQEDLAILSSPGNSIQPQGIWVWTWTAVVALLAIAIPIVGPKWFDRLNSSGASLIQNQESPEQMLSFLDVLPPVPPPPSVQIPSPSMPPMLATKDPLPPPEKISIADPPPRNPSVDIKPPTPPISSSSSVSPFASPQLSTANNYYQTPNQLPAKDNLTLQGSRIPTIMPSSPLTMADRISAIPSIPTLPSLQAEALVERSPEEQTPELPIINPLSQNYIFAEPIPRTTLLDAIPQVAEARQYFQQRWEPPRNLSQTLEYRLIIQSDGSLKQAVPLGKAAIVYYQKASIPAPGSAFVSSLDILENQTIRLVLSPDGRVKTFLE
ncbi:hypothetical protein RGRSB_0918 [cyanobacterium endosymbiont of Rhopalodia gibberula]|uniref:DUF4335 domain-containing protein n=1 Tax=cyanobacterium endosymbiont of Rhopalodia gibberula TaxID=1763363 RepID=UPI000DC6E3BE|nr:DUF4335 domain-containing protein [cyanobacterium endosymbiont of Rhopalodia gibberula]BBA79436.1 hypothetical protein RGRSB_0918 [cyanobacterium endosymbiont of Rhopalodia gibberula]